MYTLCIVLVLIASVLMVLAVLVQNPKSGMASNFGASNQVMGVRQTADFLEKFTWGAAVAILALSLLSVAMIDKKSAGASVPGAHKTEQTVSTEAENQEGGEAATETTAAADAQTEAKN